MIQTHQPELLVGTWRRFGALGPVYEIVATGKPLTDGDRIMRIRVLESGEEMEKPRQRAFKRSLFQQYRSCNLLLA